MLGYEFIWPAWNKALSVYPAVTDAPTATNLSKSASPESMSRNTGIPSIESKSASQPVKAIKTNERNKYLSFIIFISLIII